MAAMDGRPRVAGWKRAPWRACAVLGLGAAALLGAPEASGIGVAPADAKAFYTRKRVNGVWVEGRFAKPGAKAAARRRVGRAAYASLEPPAPLPPRPERAAAEPAPAGGHGALHAALQAKAQAMAVGLSSPVAAATEPARPAPEPARPEPARLAPELARSAPEPARPALEAAVQPAAETRAPSPTARSVSFDFETGIKTTRFDGDVLVREPFDVATLRPLASPPPPPPALSEATASRKAGARLGAPGG